MLLYLRLVLPVYVQVPLEALQGQTQTSPPTLGGRFYDLFPTLTVLSQTLAFSETHFGLKETEEETILMCVNSWLTGWQASKRMTGVFILPWVSETPCYTLKIFQGPH